MINIQQQITFLPTTDLTLVEAFYCGSLSLTKVLDQGDCVIFKTTDTAYIGFCNRKLDVKPVHVILTLVTDQVVEFYDQLQNKGITCEAPPKLNEKYQIFHFFVKDPNGYLVEIQQFIDGFDGR